MAHRLVVIGGGPAGNTAATTAARLGFPDGASVPVSWSGGVFAAPAVLTDLRTELAGLGGYELRRPLHPPVVGAALHAAALAGTPLDDAALHHLRSSTSGPAPRGDDDVPAL